MGLRDGLSPDDRDRFDEWARFQREHNIAALAESAMVISIYPGAEHVQDIEYILQTGAAVLLDKPILVLIADGSSEDELPPKLRMVADEILSIDRDAADLGSPELGDKIAAFAKRFVKDPAG
ncbi:MAG TPA: hypothetical protein VF731_01710 [Solirubrobacterales bacterium]